MENKKNEALTPELEEESLDAVTGGIFRTFRVPKGLPPQEDWTHHYPKEDDSKTPVTIEPPQ